MMNKKRRKKVLFVCSSVFQLYVAITIKIIFFQDRCVDLVLTDSTPVFRQLYLNKKLISLFNNVKFVEVGKNIGKLNRLQRSKYGQCFYEIFPKKYVKKVWEIDVKDYQELFFSSYIKQNVLIQYAIKKSCKKNKVNVFEDGISTYLLKNMQKSYVPPFIKKLFKIKEVEKCVDNVYMFEPNLMCVGGYKNIIKIPNPTTNKEVITVLSEIFEDNGYKIKEKFIFLEESFNNDGYTTNDVELIHNLYDYCERKNFILKHHPRNRLDRFKTVLPTMEKNIFWENYLLKNSLDDKVLVAVSSNTVFVPHIILNEQKPTIILLYKIFKGTSPILGSENFEKYVEKYYKLYSDYTKDKMFIPQTIQEYEEIIRKLAMEEND